MPANNTTRMPMIAESVRCALRTAGSRNALTPLLTASTPVIAVQPLAKARNTIHHPAVVVAANIAGGAITATGWPPITHALISPIPSTVNKQRTKRYVGTTNAKPDSRTPRRLTMAMNARMPKHSRSVWGWSAGTAETRAPTPAEILVRLLHARQAVFQTAGLSGTSALIQTRDIPATPKKSLKDGVLNVPSPEARRPGLLTNRYPTHGSLTRYRGFDGSGSIFLRSCAISTQRCSGWSTAFGPQIAFRIADASARGRRCARAAPAARTPSASGGSRRRRGRRGGDRSRW